MAVTDEHEPIRLEELPQVDLRKNAGVTRIARALEAVEGERGERVGRSDLVDDEEAPARARDAHELGENELRPRDVMERPERAREIEGAVVERQMLGVALDERHVPVVDGTFPGQFQQLGDPVDADDLPHDRREREGERARAGTDVDRALVTARENERVHDAGECRGALVLVRGDLFGRAREPVRHRRPRGGLAMDSC